MLRLLDALDDCSRTARVPCRSPRDGLSSQQVTFHKFLQLPAEIRDQIYRHIIGIPEVEPSTVVIIRSQQRPNYDRRVWEYDEDHVASRAFTAPFLIVESPHFNILQASRQTCREASHYFYDKCTLGFAGTTPLLRFLRCIGRSPFSCNSRLSSHNPRHGPAGTMLILIFLVGKRRRQQITRVFFQWRGPDAKEAFRLVKTCGSLEAITFTQPCTICPGYEALREVRGLKQAISCIITHAYASDQENENPRPRHPTLSAPLVDFVCRQFLCNCDAHLDQRVWPQINREELQRAMMRPPKKRAISKG